MAKFIPLTILAFFFNLAPFFASAYESSAQFAILLDYNTGKIIYSKNGSERMAPSSMSKLMTLYIIFEELKSGRLKLTDMVNVSEKAWRIEGSKMFIEVNSKVSVSDLLRGIIIQSGNDASIALAEHISGDEKNFVKIMNEKANVLGLGDSHFENATGLPHPEHYMSSHDIAILGSRLIKEFNEYYPLFSEKEFTYNNITQPNRNAELDDNGVDGIKTGHTESGGYGIIISAIKDNRRLIAVVNGLSTEKARLQEAKNLLTYGFDNFYNLLVARANVPLDVIPVLDGEESQISAVLIDNVELLLPINISQDQVQILLKKPSILIAPIAKNEQVGDLAIVVADKPFENYKLIADKEVEPAGLIVRLYNNLNYRINNFKFQ